MHESGLHRFNVAWTRLMLITVTVPWWHFSGFMLTKFQRLRHYGNLSKYKVTVRSFLHRFMVLCKCSIVSCESAMDFPHKRCLKHDIRVPADFVEWLHPAEGLLVDHKLRTCPTCLQFLDFIPRKFSVFIAFGCFKFLLRKRVPVLCPQIQCILFWWISYWVEVSNTFLFHI
jgi:hypothetical protein